jgi:hypothetical protein
MLPVHAYNTAVMNQPTVSKKSGHQIHQGAINQINDMTKQQLAEHSPRMRRRLV